MPLHARRARADDLESIVALTSASRRRLAAWSPRWWRAAAEADQLHALWLAHLIESDDAVARVAADGDVLGCVITVAQPGQWFVDDVAVCDDTRWPDVGRALLGAVEERPALSCVPTAHTAQAQASEAAGLRLVSSYWIAETGMDAGTVEPIARDLALPPAPPHTFGGAGGFDPAASGALAFAHSDGFVVGSPSVAAPPVYDPGGTVAVVDRVTGPDRGALLHLALSAAARRGDVLVAVVAAAEDRTLEAALHSTGFERTVEVYAWI